MLPVPAGLYIWTGLEAARCAIQLFRHIRTSKAERPGFDEFGNHFRRRGTRALRVLYGTVAGAYPKHRRCRSPVDGKIPAPVHDVEKARDCQKESFEIAFGQEGGSEDRGCRSCMTSLWLVRNLAGILLLYPTCMLVMSGYAATRGLLREFGSWESEVQTAILPQFLLRPSPLVFFLASVVWTVLEYIHYQGNAEDNLQKTILGATVLLGLLPCIGHASSALGILVCTLPWIVHAGLVFSDLLHDVWELRSRTTTMAVLPCDALTTRL